MLEKSWKWRWNALAFLPFIFLTGWITRLAIDMPYLDSWALVPLLEKFYTGTLTPGDMFAQHNESRIPLLRMLTVTGAVFTGWNTNYELATILLLASLIFLLLTRQVGRVCRQCWGDPPPWLWVMMSLLFFSTIQYENWTFGLTITGTMNCAGTVAGLVLLTRPFFSWRRLGAALLAGVVALYSYSNGVLFFGVALLPLWAGMREARRWRAAALLVWLLATALLIAGFFYGYHSTFKMPPPAHYAAHVDQLLKYFFVLLGGAIANSPRLPDWIPCGLGLAGCGLFILLACHALIRPPSARRELSFWTALGVYTLLTALAVAGGRCFFFGVSNALSSRYAMISSLFWICLLVMAVVELRTTTANGWRRRAQTFCRYALALCMVICLGLFAVSSVDNLTFWRAKHATLMAVREELLCDVPDQSLLTRSYTSWALLQPRMDFLTREKLSLFREKREFCAYQTVDGEAGGIDEHRFNHAPAAWLAPNRLEINGRAFGPGAPAPARRVILVDPAGQIIAGTPVDTAADYQQAPWHMMLASAKLSVNTTVQLRIFAVMRDNAHITPLGQLAVEFPSAARTPIPADMVFDDQHHEIAGWTDFFRTAAEQVYGVGWARDPDTGAAGAWVLVTDAATNVLGYTCVDMDRADVAQQLHAPQLLKCGWRVALHKSVTGTGHHVLRAWLFQPARHRALKLANDFAVVVE